MRIGASLRCRAYCVNGATLKTVFNVAGDWLLPMFAGVAARGQHIGAENAAFAVADDQQREHVRQTRVKVGQGMHGNFLAGPEGLAHQTTGQSGRRTRLASARAWSS